MRNRGTELREPALAVQYLLVEQILMVTVQRLALKIFVVAIAESHGRSRQHVFDTAVQARLLPLGCLQRVLDRQHNAFDARTIGLGIAFGGSGAERLFPEVISQKVLGAGPQE